MGDAVDDVLTGEEDDEEEETVVKQVRSRKFTHEAQL